MRLGRVIFRVKIVAIMKYSLRKFPKGLFYATHLCCAIFFVFLFVPKISVASTEIFEDITTDTMWNSEGSPYVILDDIDVGVGVTLTINQGVVVKFVDGGALNVSGFVVGQGVEQDKIYFTSFENDAVLGDTNGDEDGSLPYPSWSLNILNGGQSTFSHTNFSYSEGISLVNFNTGYFSDIEMIESSDGFYVNNGTLTLERSSFLNMDDSVVTGFSSEVNF